MPNVESLLNVVSTPPAEEAKTFSFLLWFKTELTFYFKLCVLCLGL